MFSFTSFASYNYSHQMNQFKAHNIRDTHHDFWVNKTIPGYRQEVLIFNDTKGHLPWFASKGCYMAFTFLMLSWVYRIKFIRNSTKVTYTCRKLILN